MTPPMRPLKFLLLSLLLLLLTGAKSPSQMDMENWRGIAGHIKYGRAPRELTALPDTCGALLLAFKPPPLGWAITGAVLQREADSAGIAMASFENNLVLFPHLATGTYRLRVIRLAPAHFGVLTSSDYIVTYSGQRERIEAGKVRPDLLRVSIGATIWSDSKVMKEDSPDLERAAWDGFHRKFGESTWSENVATRDDSRVEEPEAAGDSSSSAR